MPTENTIQKEISSYISALFRTHFGKGPSAVYVTIENSFITIHFRGFLAAMEKNLMNQNEMKRVLVTRDMIIRNLEPDITRNIEAIAGHHVTEFYTDWNPEKETGLMICIIDEDVKEQQMKWPDTADGQALREYIKLADEKSQKTPDRTDIYWLNDRMVLARRSGVLLEIEKEFIRQGFIEELKLSKRSLEHRALKEAQLESVLTRNIDETFLYWNFAKDLGYIIFRLEPEKR